MVSYNISGPIPCGSVPEGWNLYSGGPAKWNVVVSEEPCQAACQALSVSADRFVLTYGKGCLFWAVWDQAVMHMRRRFSCHTNLKCGALALSGWVRPAIYRGFCPPRIRHRFRAKDAPKGRRVRHSTCQTAVPKGIHWSGRKRGVDEFMFA